MQLMPDGSNASALRSRIVDIDSQLLSIVLNAPLAQEDISKIGMLEHARTAQLRLLVVAESAEMKNE